MIGSFFIASGWNWYHLAKRPHWRFALITLGMTAGLVVGFIVFKKAYRFAVRRWKRHAFWQTDFFAALDSLFFIFSLNFLVFFSRVEILSLFIVSITIALFFLRLHKFLAKHPNSSEWQGVNKMIFVLFYFLFLLNNLLQYVGYNFYILDPNARFYNIVLFRSFSMTMFWLLGFAVSGFLILHIKSFLKYFFVALWSALHLSVLFLWVVNVGVLYFSGLYFSPVALEHAEGGGGVMWNWLTYLLFACYLLVLISFIVILKKLIKGYRHFPRRLWNYYNAMIILTALAALIGFGSFRTTPEYTIIKNFYQYYRGQTPTVSLAPEILVKLKKFGLEYDLNKFNIAQKSQAYNKELNALPKNLQVNKPNVVIIFWESLSSRLTSVYGNQYQEVTPGLEAMASDPHTTVIKKYFNASTPTVTGLLAQLCSFLPPTGHEEFERARMLKHVYLYCLPEILKDNGYANTSYITAVDKKFANKGELLASMGTDDFFGTQELAEYIHEEPLAWGYSDHQMFPMIKEVSKKAAQPYLIMLSTVDSHPPFNIAKDEVPYQDGKNAVLNSMHTTDDAFAKFWEDFRNSPEYDNTIVIVAADHAIFPAAYSKEMLKNAEEKMTFYDENAFMIYVPNGNLPKEVDIYSSSIDFTPTVLQVLG
ncbi:LTA synthase family protein, partial [Patescibacteria group bacterium]|nr:LTA synthase family protein [Patescibacteria group bacterium]